MVIVAKYDIELSEWEIVPANTELELVHLEYNGFVVVRYNGNAYFLNKGYFQELPSLVNNY